MSDVRLVALNGDDAPRKYGYESGVGHAFLVPSGFQGDPLAWLSGESEAPTACGRTADGERLVEKLGGDRMCGRCLRVVTDDMIAVARADKHREPTSGESVAAMIVADPSAVLIGLDAVLAEEPSAEEPPAEEPPAEEPPAEEPPAEEPPADAAVDAFVAELFTPEMGVDGKPWVPGDDPARRVSESVADMPVGPERDRAIAALWSGAASKGAKNAGQKTARQSDWKPVKEVPEAVACESGAAFTDRGDGTGTCRSCGWVGPVKEVETSPAVKTERVWCSGGKIGTDGCTACGRDVKVTRAGNMARHKTPGVEQEATYGTAMVAHWKHGRSPVNVITLLESEEQREPKREPLAVAPATVDSGRKSADDVVGGAAAGVYRGHTSLTRGGDMTGAVPKERVEGGKPVSTTLDSKLGGLRTDVSARTDKKVVATESGAEVVDDKVGGPCGYLSSAEYEAMRGKPGFAAFKKSYWRKVRRARLADERNRARKAASKGKGKR